MGWALTALAFPVYVADWTLWAAGGAAAALYVAAQILLLAAYLRRRRLAAADRDEPFRRALAARLQGRTGDARAMLEELLDRDPSDVEALLLLAAVARDENDLDAARQHLERARYLDERGRHEAEIRRRLRGVAAGA